MKVSRLCFALLFVVLFTHVSWAQTTDALIAKVESQIKATDFENAISTIVEAQENGQASAELSKLLVKAYAGRIDQVGVFKKRSIAKKIRATMEQVVELAPDDLNAKADLANFHIMAPGMIGGDKEVARQLIDAIALKDATKADVLNGSLAAANKNTEEAFSLYDKVLTADADNEDALSAKGLLLVEQKSFPQAIETLHQCMVAHPDNMECAYQLGKTAQTEEIELDKGVAAFTHFISNNDYDVDYVAHAHLRLGHIYALMDEKEKARSEYEMAIQVNDLKSARKALKKLK